MRRPIALAAVVVAVYAVSLGGGWLNYDDRWLVRDNPLLRSGDARDLVAVWTDLARRTRDLLGSEFLPVRDTFVWLELRVFGLWPQALRACSLALYVAGALLARAYLVRAVPDPRVGELAAWLFALHPAHAESVAWLAGQKDLLALTFVAAALLLYTSQRFTWLVPFAALLATLGKAVAVVAPLLLLLDDWMRARRPRWGVVAASTALVGAAFLVQLQVGRQVGMLPVWAGGSRLATAATMGPVWLAYLGQAFVPVRMTVHYDVPVRGPGSPLAWAGYLVLLALAGAAVWWFRKGHRLPAWALGVFVVALGPTSQLLAPLQNLRADRYLLLAVLGPCAVLAALAVRVPSRALLVGVPVIFGALTVERAWVFADSVRLWQDATARTERSPRAPYQLGMALQERGATVEAEAAFAAALARARPDDDEGRAAANNLAASYAGRGRLDLAQALLRRMVIRFPGDPRVLNNLAEITARRGDDAEARRLFQELVRKFPSYDQGRRNYHKRYGTRP